MIYYGEEIGMEDGDIPLEKTQDPWPLRAGVPEISRVPCRTPMQWSAEKGAGFSKTSGSANPPEPWLPIHKNYLAINVNSQNEDMDSMLSFYRRLIKVRRATPALLYGDYRPLELNVPKVFAYVRKYNDQARFILLNYSDQPVRVNLPDDANGVLILSTNVDRTTSDTTKIITLDGYEGCLFS